MAACVPLLIAGSAPGGCGDARTPTDQSAVQSTVAPAPAPPVADSLAGVEFFEGWSDPRSLPFPVNTSGWEDSSFISLDGNTLYFGYSRLNHIALSEGRVVVDGPDRPGQNGPAFDIYEARIEANAWRVTHSSVNAPDPELHEAAIGVDRGSATMAFVQFVAGGDIFLTHREGDRWGPPEKLPAPVNTSCIEDNPHLSPDGQSLYFDSNRSGENGLACRDTHEVEGRDIWATERTDGGWSVPVRLRGAPNSTGLRWQVFLNETAELAYWSGTDSDCGGRSCLYRARRQVDGSYQERTIIARAGGPDSVSAGDVIAIGEMSITADGRFLYFTYMALRGPGDVDLSIGVARKR